MANTTGTVNTQLIDNDTAILYSFNIGDDYVGGGGYIIAKWKLENGDGTFSYGTSSLSIAPGFCPGYYESTWSASSSWDIPSGAVFTEVIDKGIELVSRRKKVFTIKGIPSGDKSITAYRGAIIDGRIYCDEESFYRDYNYDGTLYFTCDVLYSWPGIVVSIYCNFVSVHITPKDLGDDDIYELEFKDAYEIITAYGNSTSTPPPNVFCGNHATGYTHGTPVTISLNDLGGCVELLYWEVNRDGVTENVYSPSVTINARKFGPCGVSVGHSVRETSVTPITRRKKYNVVISCSPENAGDAYFDGSSESEREVFCGDPVTVQASPECCYWLDYWSINGDVSLCIKPKVDIYSNTNIVAHFTKKKFKTVGDYLVYDENGNLIYGCGGNPIYGNSVEDVSEKPQLVDCQ